MGEKRFDTIHDLVADGLIILYIELHAKDYVSQLGNHCKYEESPYMTIVRDRHSSKNKKTKNKLKSIMEVKRLSINELIEEEPEKENEKEIDISLIEKAHIFKNENFMGFPFCWCECLNMWKLLMKLNEFLGSSYLQDTHTNRFLF